MKKSIVVAILLLLGAQAGWGAVALIQSANTGTSCSGSSCTLTFPASVVAGHLITIHVRWLGSATILSVGGTTNGVFSAASGSFVHETSFNTAGAIYYRQNTVPGAERVTVVWSAPVSFPAISGEEWSGLSTTGSLDQTGSGSATASVSTRGPTQSTSELVYAGLFCGAPPTAGTGFTPIQTTLTSGTASNTEYQIGGSQAVYQATWAGCTGVASIATFFTSSGQRVAYYVAANGSDSNSGKTKDAPLLHAPGMSGCGGVCASIQLHDGDSVFLRGGDTWHNCSTTNKPCGLPWTFAGNWTGIFGSSVYVGVDGSWFNPDVCSSSCRAILNGDGQVVGGSNYFLLLPSPSDYITVDNLEFTGFFWNDNVPIGRDFMLGGAGIGTIFSNLYFHNWSHADFGSPVGPRGTGTTKCVIVNNLPTGTCDGAQAMSTGSNQTLFQGMQIVNNLVDGSDTNLTCPTGFAQSYCPSLSAIIFDGYDIHGNTIRFVSNGVVTNNTHTFHDNLLEFIFEPSDNFSHGNAFEFNGEWNQGSEPNTVYNNVVRHTGTAVAAWTCPNPNLTSYYYNNVVFDSVGPPWSFATDCGGAAGAYFWNNTLQRVGAGAVFSSRGTGGIFQNNHMIFDAPAVAFSGTPVVATFNVSDTNSAANSQGYTASNNYGPTTSSKDTISTGTNLTSDCTLLALCGDTSLGGTRAPNPRPSTGAWNVGAFQLATSSAIPNPPAGLGVVVH